MAKEDSEKGDKLLRALETIVISPENARALVDKYEKRARKKGGSESEVQAATAKGIVTHYARLCAASGAVSALPGSIPGIGTAVAIVGGSSADLVVTMKFQVDMCFCLAGALGQDLGDEEKRQLAFLLAAGATVEKLGAEGAVKMGSKAGVALLRQYLRGAALQATKQLFKRIGIVFTRKALEKAIPFGIGVVVGSAANYWLTNFVGGAAIKWFHIDRESRASN